MAYAVLRAVAVRLEREGRLRGPLPATFSPADIDSPSATSTSPSSARRCETSAPPPERASYRANALRAVRAPTALRSRYSNVPRSRSSSAASASAASAANANAPPTDIRATPSEASSATLGVPAQREHAHGPVDRLDDPADVLGARDPGREQHIGAGLLVGRDARSVSARSSRPRMWFSAAGGDHQLDRPRVCDLDGCRDPLDGQARGRRSARPRRPSSPRPNTRPARPRSPGRSSRRRRPGRRRTRSRGRPTPGGRCRRRALRHARGPRPE